MKLSLLLLMPLLIKPFIITHNNMPAVTIADNEIICRYFSFPLLVAMQPQYFDYLNEDEVEQYNKNAFIIKKKHDYNCGIQVKFSAYNKAPYESVVAPKGSINYLNYEFFQLTAIRKENCHNNNAIVSCDNSAHCYEHKTICCDGDFCNDYNNIKITEDLYLFDKQKFLNHTVNALCFNIPDTKYKIDLYGSNVDIRSRTNATCSIVSLKKKYSLPVNNGLTKTNKITSIINLAEDKIICNFCVFPNLYPKQNYNREYKQQCDNAAFIIAKKSQYRCSLQAYFYESFVFKSLSWNNKISHAPFFLMSAVKNNKCRPQSYSFFCRIRSKIDAKKSILCCNKSNCNHYNNIIFSMDIYSTTSQKFLKNTTNESPPANTHRQVFRTCTFMKFNTTKINELAAIKDKSENTNKNMCDCNNQDNLVSSYVNLLILVLSTFFYNNN